MKLISALVLTLFFYGCKKPPGSVTGNVFWKYNDYVGDKADAGSYVYMFSKDTSEPPYRVRCDVGGNFKFDFVPPGDYLLACVSKNTNQPNETLFRDLADIDSTLGEYLGFSFQKSNPDILNKINKEDEIGIKPWQFEEIEKSCDTVVNELYDRTKMSYLITGAWHRKHVANKIYFETIQVESKRTYNTVIDNGTTFSSTDALADE